MELKERRLKKDGDPAKHGFVGKRKNTEAEEISPQGGIERAEVVLTC